MFFDRMGGTKSFSYNRRICWNFQIQNVQLYGVRHVREETRNEEAKEVGPEEKETREEWMEEEEENYVRVKQKTNYSSHCFGIADMTSVEDRLQRRWHVMYFLTLI